MTTVAIKNQYTTSTISGTRKEVISKLRKIALEKRSQFRDLYNIPQNVHRAHTSKNEIVNVATYGIGKMGLDRLITMLNYGVEKYTVMSE